MRLEYVTAPVSVSVFNPISVNVVNHSAMTESVRIQIHYRNADGVGLLNDTGDVEVTATGTYSVGIVPLVAATTGFKFTQAVNF